MPLRWFGIEDADRRQIALVGAIGIDDVAKVYLEQCRPGSLYRPRQQGGDR